MAEQTKVPDKPNMPESKRSHLGTNARLSAANANPSVSVQGAAGNLAIQRMLQSRAIQAKLTVSQPNDPYEREADRVADHVMRMPESQLRRQAVDVKKQIIQAKTVTSQITPLLDRQVKEEDSHQTNKLQDTTSAVSPTAKEYIDNLQGHGQPLPDTARAYFESRLGYDFSGVRLHTNAQAAKSARRVNALAYTVGQNIVFDAGLYAPNTKQGQWRLAHELAHTLQQGAVCRKKVMRSDTKARGAHEPVRTVDLESRDLLTPTLFRQPSPLNVTSKPDAVEEWWKKLPALEGSLSAWKAQAANATDRGGETNYGLTWATFQKLRPSATMEDFEKVTEGEVENIARGLFRFYKADQVVNTGVAILIADAYWGGFSADAVNRALEKVGQTRTATMAPLNDATIRGLNAADPQELIDALTEERIRYYSNIVAKNPKQKVFQRGWNRRAIARWIQAKMVTGHAEEAARWLNGQSLEILNEQFALMSRREIDTLHAAAVRARGVGPQSRLSKETAKALYRVSG